MVLLRPSKAALARCVAGVLAAALLFELGLRPFVAGWNQPEGPVRTVRSYYEGFSDAHFEPDGLGTYGNRLTGNPPVPGAPETSVLLAIVPYAAPTESTGCVLAANTSFPSPSIRAS